jgi:hypothetical protein
VLHDQSSAASSWTVQTAAELPFQGYARYVDSVTPQRALRSASNSIRYLAPYADVEQGAGRDQIVLRWPEAVRGEVQVTLRMDS